MPRFRCNNCQFEVEGMKFVCPQCKQRKGFTQIMEVDVQVSLVETVAPPSPPPAAPPPERPSPPPHPEGTQPRGAAVAPPSAPSQPVAVETIRFKRPAGPTAGTPPPLPAAPQPRVESVPPAPPPLPAKPIAPPAAPPVPPPSSPVREAAVAPSAPTPAAAPRELLHRPMPRRRAGGRGPPLAGPRCLAMDAG